MASVTGSLARNPHQGSRTEYLAQYVISGLGSAVAVPHQEDSGIDLYCTLGTPDPEQYRRLVCRHPFYVQVKSTSTPIHTGEQIYLRQGFQGLIEKHAVDIIGPDPCDVGGIMELKWIAEYADMHGILMAPHGIGDGPIGINGHSCPNGGQHTHRRKAYAIDPCGLIAHKRGNAYSEHGKIC